MPRSVKIILLLILIIAPVIFYSVLSKRDKGIKPALLLFRGKVSPDRAKIALIFDDLGESLYELQEVYSLGIPLTVSVIPDLKFSKNIAHISGRWGFSVLIHLPLEPLDRDKYKKLSYRFIGSNLTKKEIETLLKQYLNSIRIAIGVNNHMGSRATKDPQLMGFILKVIKNKGLIFIDSRTSSGSIGYEIAKREKIICGYNEGFLDATDDTGGMEKRMEGFIAAAKKNGQIIIIAHPRKNTIQFLKKRLSLLTQRIEFITIKDYFGL